MRRWTVALVALALLAACGGDGGTLERAERAMAELDAGTLSLQLAATAEDVTEPVGFRVDGSFSYTSDGELPILDFEYTELLGGDEHVTSVVSDGSTVTIEVDGEEHELTPEEAASLRLGDDEGFADLGIASWVEDPEEEERGDMTVVVGRVDAADLLSDIARIASQVSGGDEVPALDGDAADRLARLVSFSSIEIVVGDGDLPRSIDAVLDFAGEVPDELVDALGPYAAASLRLTVELEPQR